MSRVDLNFEDEVAKALFYAGIVDTDLVLNLVEKGLLSKKDILELIEKFNNLTTDEDTFCVTVCQDNNFYLANLLVVLQKCIVAGSLPFKGLSSLDIIVPESYEKYFKF